MITNDEQNANMSDNITMPLGLEALKERAQWFVIGAHQQWLQLVMARLKQHHNAPPAKFIICCSLFDYSISSFEIHLAASKIPRIKLGKRS